MASQRVYYTEKLREMEESMVKQRELIEKRSKEKEEEIRREMREKEQRG
jgi:hypothetical protein